MKAKVIYRDKRVKNGVEVSHALALELSNLVEIAAVVCHETAKLQTVYTEGRVMQYDPVSCKFV